MPLCAVFRWVATIAVRHLAEMSVCHARMLVSMPLDYGRLVAVCVGENGACRIFNGMADWRATRNTLRLATCAPSGSKPGMLPVSSRGEGGATRWRSKASGPSGR